MFKQLKIYLFFVSLPFVMLLVGASIFSEGIKTTITRNPHPQINYTIFAIILIGGCLVLINTWRLIREAAAIQEFFGAVHEKVGLTALQNLANRYSGETACLLQMVAASGGRNISHQEQVAIENELSNTRTGLLRRNALPSYLTGLLVGMGLLGTFIGLLATLNDITVLISSFADLDMQNASPLVVFRTMIDKMRAPMQSMGIAFSASMFGLLGSIILGLMMVGVRRLQGDMFSKLSSEIGRHIEIALSHESVVQAVAVEGGGEVATGDVTKALIRIEERYAEAARLQQRALSTLIDDIQAQRTDMLRALTEQSDANNGLRGELQQLSRQLGSIFSVMEKGSGETSDQLSELAIHLASETKENHRLLAMQVEEQQRLRESLDSYKIEERLTEATRTQQRALASVIDDFAAQRSEMLSVLTRQIDAENNSRSELQQLRAVLDNISAGINKGNDAMTGQLSELTVLLAADAKETQLVLNSAGEGLRGELQQLGEQFGKGLDGMQDELCTKLTELMAQMATDVKKTHEKVGQADNNIRTELQQLGRQLGTISTVTEKGNDEICTQISAMITRMSGDDKDEQKVFVSPVE